VLDASGKLPPGVIAYDAVSELPPGVVIGNMQWLGSYKECLAIKRKPGVNDTGPVVSSHYCVVDVGQSILVSIDTRHHHRRLRKWGGGQEVVIFQ